MPETGPEIPQENPYKGKHITEIGIRTRKGAHGAKSETVGASEPEEKGGTGEKATGFVEGVAAAVAATEGPKVVNALGRAARRIAWGTSERRRVWAGGGAGKPPEGNPPPTGEGDEERRKKDEIHNAAFAKVMSMSNDQTLPAEERKKWGQEKDLRKTEFEKFDNGDFVADTGLRFQTIMRTSEWDAESGKGVYDRLNSYSEARDAEYNGRSDSDPRLKGLIGVAIRAEAAKVVASGIATKLKDLNAGDRQLWLKGKNYTDREVNRLGRLASENHIFDFATDAPAELVGAALPKEPMRVSESVATVEALNKLNQNIEALLNRVEKAFESQGDALGVALKDISTDNARAMVEAFGDKDPGKERQRWSDTEHKQQFYARFTPNIEPGFYKLLSSEKREEFDARWQLARAAFIKRATAGAPDKYRENQELELFGREQMEILYKLPGVKLMLEGYAQAITNSRTFNVDGRQISFWQIKDADTFLKFRDAMRREILSNAGIFSNTEEVREAEESRRGWWADLLRKEADAVAWNWIWAGNLTESADSRYSFSGISAPNIPSAISAGEYKYVLHPQERFEAKSSSGHFWGIFGKWGVTQLKRIKDESNLRGDRDEIRFLAASRNNYWEWDKTNEPSSDPRKAAAGGKIFEVYVPECYTTAPCGSFWEETKISQFGANGRERKMSLLDYLRTGDSIPWEDVSQDAWSIYLFGKFHKAYQLLEYFNPEKPPQKFDMRQDGWGSIWANPLLELFTRLGLDRQTKGLVDSHKSHQTFHNLKVWLVYAGFGGVKNIDSRNPTVPLDSRTKDTVTNVLRHRNVKYLKGRGLLPGGEGLNIE